MSRICDPFAPSLEVEAAIAKRTLRKKGSERLWAPTVTRAGDRAWGMRMPPCTECGSDNIVLDKQDPIKGHETDLAVISFRCEDCDATFSLLIVKPV